MNSLVLHHMLQQQVEKLMLHLQKCNQEYQPFQSLEIHYLLRYLPDHPQCRLESLDCDDQDK